MATECDRLGHVYGEAGRCLFCRERKLAPGEWTKTVDETGITLRFCSPLDYPRLDIGPVVVMEKRLRPELEWKPDLADSQSPSTIEP